jgi:hypothetical protein
MTVPYAPLGAPCFRLKCVLCGHVEQKFGMQVDEDGPACSRCLGPMTVEQVAVRFKPRRKRRSKDVETGAKG